MTSTPSSPAGGPVSTWVPVDRRWLGLDRRTLVPALVVAVVGILFGGVLPLVNNAIDYDDETVSGDVLVVSKGITVVPPVGWQLQSGLRSSDTGISPAVPPIVLSSSGATVTVSAIASAEDADAILDDFNTLAGKTAERPKFTVTGGRVSTTSDSGVAGTLERYAGVGVEGLLAVHTFPERDVAVAVQVEGPPGQLSTVQPDIDQILQSLQRDGASA